MKTIMSMTQKKRNGLRKAKYYFGIDHGDDGCEFMNYKQFKALEQEFVEPGQYTQKEVLKALLAQFVQFSKKVDYNMWCKKTNPTFIQKVDKLIEMGAKWTKAGLLSVE